MRAGGIKRKLSAAMLYAGSAASASISREVFGNRETPVRGTHTGTLYFSANAPYPVRQGASSYSARKSLFPYIC